MKEVIHSLASLLLYRRLNFKGLHLLVLFMIMGFPVVIDLVNGFMIQIVHADFSLGVLYRGLIMLLLLPCLLWVREFWFKLFLALVIIMWLLSNIFWMEKGLDYSFEAEFLVFSKIFYAWVLYAYLSFVTQKYDIPIEQPMKFMVFFGTIAAASILFSYLSGYGISTYERASTFAVKSYFKSQNDIGLTILISLVFCMYFFTRYGRWMYGVYAMLTMVGLILLGTRAGVMGGFATLGVFTTLFILRTLNSRKRSGKRVLLVGFMLSTIVAGLIYTVTLIAGHSYLINKYSSLLEGTPRENLEVAAQQRLDERGFWLTLMGEGDHSFRIGVLKYYPGKGKALSAASEPEEGKSVEQDIYDLIGPYGLLLGGFVLLVICLMFFKALVSFLVSWRLLDFTFVMAFTLLLVHSFLAGHALRSAVVAAAAALIYLYAIDLAKPPFRRRRLPVLTPGENA